MGKNRITIRNHVLKLFFSSNPCGTNPNTSKGILPDRCGIGRLAGLRGTLAHTKLHLEKSLETDLSSPSTLATSRHDDIDRPDKDCNDMLVNMKCLYCHSIFLHKILRTFHMKGASASHGNPHVLTFTVYSSKIKDPVNLI